MSGRSSPPAVPRWGTGRERRGLGKTRIDQTRAFSRVGEGWNKVRQPGGRTVGSPLDQKMCRLCHDAGPQRDAARSSKNKDEMGAHRARDVEKRWFNLRRVSEWRSRQRHRQAEVGPLRKEWKSGNVSS